MANLLRFTSADESSMISPTGTRPRGLITLTPAAGAGRSPGSWPSRLCAVPAVASAAAPVRRNERRLIGSTNGVFIRGATALVQIRGAGSDELREENVRSSTNLSPD